MLIVSQSGKRFDKIKAEFLAALKMKDDMGTAAWPLPNAKQTDEKTFWGWRACHSFSLEAWNGQIRIGNEWATVLLYYLGHSQFIDGGFAVAVFRNYQKERVEYWEWRACDHEFTETNIGRCLYRYICSKCKKHYDVDSSG